MFFKKTQYITTTLPYVNADPHIGFAYEILAADVIARTKKSEVFLNTGTDEHGQKIYKKALESGRSVEEYVDDYAGKFKELKEKLGLKDDLHFVRTTDTLHIKAAQEMWRRCFERGDIYKKKYKGLYCEGDEAFIKETDLVDGKCPNHPDRELQVIEEENYFFKLQNYKEKLKDYLKVGTIVPEWRREEALKMLDGMEDFSISREKSRLPWGVSVPGDEDQVMYVWFDALTSYISTLGWPGDEKGSFKKFWEKGHTLQLAGKDQVKFQSIIWQAMLMSAGVKNTDQVFYHGFINSGGQKMSKSVGNVISPDDLIGRYGTEATRYLLLRHVHPFEDTDVTWDRLDEWYEAGLSNGIGNLTSRIMKLAETYLPKSVRVSYKDFESIIDNFELQKAMNHVWGAITELDVFIQEKKPWETKDVRVIENMVEKLSEIGQMLLPFMPVTSEKIHTAVKNNKLESALFPRLQNR